MATAVLKADGTREPFEPSKLVSSLMRSGATESSAKEILRIIESELYDGITTSEIYSHAFAHLRSGRRGTAARYSLKRAVLDFGPSGFPFESYIAKLFEAEGYATKVDQIIKGACVEHEVDVVIKRGSDITYAEAKFHNTPGFKSDLKTVLYVQARIEDLIAAGHSSARGLVVTNTKFTDKAYEYASCKNLELLGWDYPQGRSLHDRIDKAGLYPVTALTSLTRREKMALLSQRTVLCKALTQDSHELSSIGLRGKRAQTVLDEVGALCVPGSAI